MQIIAEALRTNPESKEILRYLVAQDYINASYRLGESQNAKVVFVDPGTGSDLMKEVIAESTNHEGNGKDAGNGAT